MRSISRKLVSLALVCVFLSAGCAPPREEVLPDSAAPSPTPAGERIRIGAFIGLTGAAGQYGLSAYNGMSMAVEEANAAGGAGGRRVELIVQDTRSNQEETRVVVRRLIEEYRVAALLGEVTSARSLVAAEVAQEAGVAMLTPSSTHPEITARGDFIFRSCYTDPTQGAALALFAAETLQAKRAALLVESGQQYSTELGERIREEFERRGGRVVFEEEYEAGAADFGALLERVMAAGPDVVFVPGYYLEAGLFARQAERLGIKAPLVGGDGWDSPRLSEIGGEALAGDFFSSHFSAQDEREPARRFVAEYRRLYGSAPDAFAATAYDAARILLAAFERAGTSDRRAVRDALAATRDFPGITGDLTFDPRGDALDVPVLIISIGAHGAREIVRRLTPAELAPTPTPTPSPTPRPRRRRGARARG